MQRPLIWFGGEIAFEPKTKHQQSTQHRKYKQSVLNARENKKKKENIYNYVSLAVLSFYLIKL